jgi:hypothetical protein
VTHYIEKCRHDFLHSQCRCPSSTKTVTVVPCNWTGCNVKEVLTDEEISIIAYEKIFQSARSLIEDWIDEDGDYSQEDFVKILKKCFELIRELEEKYV